MKEYYADLHIHIGRTKSGRAVKITGARTLTFTNLIAHARDKKGLDIVGIIDCHSPEVIDEMEELLDKGELVEHRDGGVMYGDLCILLGSELEINSKETEGPLHVLCFFPTLKTIRTFSEWLKGYMKNIHLSSQRVYVTGQELQLKTKELDGLFIPAHVFTPFKSLYGKGVQRSLTEVFNPNLIDAIELGLSANTAMADQLSELHRYTYLSNSDAHSLAKIAREYQKLKMRELSFKELTYALKEEDGRSIVANYGLNPLLGKYHRTVCTGCHEPYNEKSSVCLECGNDKFIKGVADRIAELKSQVKSIVSRPPYIHQVPLEFIPGLGPRLLEKLLDHFGTEMAVLHAVPPAALKEVVPDKIAELIVKARNGELLVHAGGGGKYGKIIHQK
ncbi:endonuclease Q family protein [Bacillus sp. B15-48]|uniref:endonuclease Q family protein n=1 Tax=Bacillus sp. B15-48 TaxID=1548601 RepID=UPI00193EFA53|nr:endonuclease Q family protein [Bacillus sp. B15-48]MBM4762192.1 TIGR00375 family protein [Bacillus sp. B15-48]